MNEWHSYHIFYFDGLLQEKLICECIAPLMKEYLEKNAIEKIRAAISGTISAIRTVRIDMPFAFPVFVFILVPP